MYLLMFTTLVRRPGLFTKWHPILYIVHCFRTVKQYPWPRETYMVIKMSRQGKAYTKHSPCFKGF